MNETSRSDLYACLTIVYNTRKKRRGNDEEDEEKKRNERHTRAYIDK